MGILEKKTSREIGIKACERLYFEAHRRIDPF